MHDTYDIKAAFFDIDGTLTSFVTHVVPQSTVDALRALQAKGVKIFICSGRAPSYMGVVLNTIPVTFDGIVGLNGQYCMDNTGLSYRHPLDQVDVERITAWLDEHTNVIANYAEAITGISTASTRRCGRHGRVWAKPRRRSISVIRIPE